jgi:uroporphyrin-3 C-methyltransferase
VLLTPDQTFFLRENLKLQLLNVRLSLLSRQVDTARADMVSVQASINRYFDPASRRVQTAATLVQQVLAQIRNTEPPRVDETLAALAAAAAGR